jgi:hypothetical protein
MTEIGEPVARRAPRSKDATIAAIAVVLAAVITASGVIIAASRREQTSQAAEIVALQQELAKKADDNKKLALEVRALKVEIERLTGRRPDITNVADPPPSPATTDAPVVQTMRNRDFAFGLQRCVRTGVTIDCQLRITNEGAEREFRLYAEAGRSNNSRAFDDRGKLQTADSGDLAGMADRRLRVDVPGTLTVPAAIRFKDVPAAVQQFTFLDVFFSASDSYDDFKVTFPNVSIQSPE